MELHGHTDIIETDLRPAVIEHHQRQAGYIEQLQLQFDRHRTRLAIVRENKRQALFEADGNC